MTSRSYRTCERIMEVVVKAGFVQRIPWNKLKVIIKCVAGGDKRTLNAYREHLVDFGFLKDLKRSVTPVFEVNLTRLNYAQTRLDEALQSRKVIAREK